MFPEQARDGTDKELARELKAITKEFVLEELKKMKEKRTINVRNACTTFEASLVVHYVHLLFTMLTC
jgi:rRNA-processing protein FCF1